MEHFTPKELKIMLDAFQAINVTMYIFCTGYLIITVFDLFKERMYSIARIISNSVLLLINILGAAIAHYAWYFATDKLWLPIVVTVLCCIGLLIVNICAINERVADDGNDNGVFNLFKSIIKHMQNVEDYKDNIKRLRTKHKYQIQ